MLKQFRSQNTKRILTILVVMVITSFVFWGVSSSLRSKKESPVLNINGQPIASGEFRELMTTSTIFYRITTGDNFYNVVNESLIESKAFEILLFLWKAKQDNITVSDKEVIDVLRRMFSFKSNFDKEIYGQAIQERMRMSPRVFEEHIRKILAVEKIVDKYVTNKTEVTDEELKEYYKNSNEKAKAFYAFIPYQRFDKDISVTDQEIQEFYAKNKEELKEKGKVKIAYIVIDKEKDKSLVKKINREIKKIKNIRTIAEKFSLSLNESPFLEKTAQIPDIEWDTKINDLAFSLEKHTLSPLIELENTYIIFEKSDEKKEEIIQLKAIRDKISGQIKREKEQKEALSLAKKLLEDGAENINAIKKTTERYKLDNATTGYFTRFDHLENIEWNDKIYDALFNLKEKQVYEEPLTTSTGIYIVALEELIPIDENKFIEEKDKYRSNLLPQKIFFQKMSFLAQLQEEMNAKK
ncbi:MAG: SurA N-terminal domain-containing protein [Candidatus Omnitrophota bacterium]